MPSVEVGTVIRVRSRRTSVQPPLDFPPYASKPFEHSGHLCREVITTAAERKGGSRFISFRNSSLYSSLKCKAIEATLSSKNQIVIPEGGREALGLKPGDKLVISVTGRKILVLEKPKSFSKAIEGLARGVYPPDYLKKERESWD